jgi:hypothetical protein
LVTAAQKARVLALRGQITEVRHAMTGVLERARSVGDAQVLVPATYAAVLCEAQEGNLDQAHTLLNELGPIKFEAPTPLAEICRLLIACDAAGNGRRLIDHVTAGPPLLFHHVTASRAQLVSCSMSTTSHRPGSPGTGRTRPTTGRTCPPWWRGAPKPRWRHCTTARLSKHSGKTRCR